jgi:hypothetical protein
MATKKSTYIPYTPGLPPTNASLQGELARATWDELHRIATSLIDLDRPVSLSIGSAETLAVSTAPAWARLFDTGVTAEWQQPSGCFEPASGVYVFPQEGLYNIYGRMNLPPFTSPAVKSYKGELRATIVHINGSPNTVYLMESGGLDDQYLTVQGQALYPLLRGDRIYFDGRAIHATKTGTISITATMQIQRVSGII